jgi:hypothetical protein
MSKDKKTGRREIKRLPFFKLAPTEEAECVVLSATKGISPKDTSDETKHTKPNSFGNYVNRFELEVESEQYMWETTTPASYALLDAIENEPLEFPFNIDLVRLDERTFKIYLKE